MSLATSYTSLRNLRIDLLFNEQENEQYRPLTIRAQAEVLTTEGAIRNLEERTTVGALSDTPLTAKQIYTNLGTVTNMHTRIQAVLKNLYLSAISDDISV